MKGLQLVIKITLVKVRNFFRFLMFNLKHVHLLRMHYCFLHRQGVRRIIPVQLNRWLNYSRYRIFYTGFFNGTKVFIKVGNDDTAFNENKIFSIINKIDSNYFLKSLINVVDNNAVYLVTPFLKMTKVANDIPMRLFKKLCVALDESLKLLRNNGVTHCDLTGNNIQLYNDDLVIFDWGCSYADIIGGGINYFDHVCSGKRIEGQSIFFDDVGSVCDFLINTRFPSYYYEDSAYIKLDSKKGKYIKEIKIDKNGFPL